MAAAFYQALIGIKPTFDLEYPDNFRAVMRAFNWIDFDWDQLAYPQGARVELASPADRKPSIRWEAF